MQSLKRLVRDKAPSRLVLPLLAWKHYWRGEPELRLLQSLVDKKKNAIDVGANRGIYTFFLSKLCPHVYAYEPNPQLYSRLTRTGIPNLSVYQIALSDYNGNSTLSVPLYENGVESDQAGTLTSFIRGDKFNTYDVKTGKLDDQGHENVGFIKIDVEGHEESILRGGEKFLKKERPNILVEVVQCCLPKNIIDVFEYIRSLGYEGHFYFQNSLHPINDFNSLIHQDMRNLLGLKSLGTKFVANFIFKSNAKY